VVELQRRAQAEREVGVADQDDVDPGDADDLVDVAHRERARDLDHDRAFGIGGAHGRRDVVRR
jgi:hypothetical protein